MRLLATAAVMLLAVAARLPADPPPKLTEHTSDAGRFRAAFPGPPRVETTTLATAAGAVHLTTEKAETGKDLIFAVTFADYPDGFDAVATKTLLDGVRDGLKGTDGRVTTDDETTLGPAGTRLTGRDIRIDAGKNSVRVRAFVDGKRLYQVMATGSRETVTGKTAEAFLASFELAK
ncbi:MAG: hypothetical protein ACRC7O_17225 [Fimbriiglobus sp.]